MSYIAPNAVTSPRRHLTLVAVLDDGRTDESPTGEENVSVALCRWRNSDGAEEPILGIRWNGSDTSPLGNPQSRGLPTWFVIPAHLRRSILERLTLSDASRALVLDAFDDFGPDGTGWICDQCGQPIRRARDGVVEWSRNNNAGGKGPGMRVVHHFLASPLKKKRGDTGCYHGGPNWEWDRLDHLLGSDGLMQLLALIADKKAPIADILNTIQRLHLSRFERARPYIDSALANGVLESNLASGFYSQRDLELVLAHQGNCASTRR
jgi:hypothetical protein